ncbi:hypothetical protein C8R45DRAFT_1110091 [Mycena sanguinolenta]|nr:hypothetical protein C8R45DRAFT_1110091 [Mycena sanguinolenta]
MDGGDCKSATRQTPLYHQVDDALVKNGLLACTGITNLAAQFECTPEVLPLLSDFANLRYLTINERAFLTVHNGAHSVVTVPSTFFPTLTHLELLGSDTGTLEHVYRSISLMPQLTHLALFSGVAERVSHAVLCANTQLRCIVFLFPFSSLAVVSWMMIVSSASMNSPWNIISTGSVELFLARITGRSQILFSLRGGREKSIDPDIDLRIADVKSC